MTESSGYYSLILVALLSAISVLISSLEAISLRRHYGDRGLFSWRTRRTRMRSSLDRALLDAYDFLFGYPKIVQLHIFRALCCVLLPLVLLNRISLAVMCGAIATSSVLLGIRGNDGQNGADQMSKLTFFSLMLALASPNRVLWRCENVFLAAQLCLAYGTSGFLRIQQPEWRNGKALLVVLRQQTYGNRFCWAFGIKHPRILRLTSMAVLIFECSFPATVLLPTRFLLPVLAFGFAFHVANAAIIGLNTFLWAYPGVYPAFAWCAWYLHVGKR